MNKVINKRGISLVALIITIIVLIILTAAVVVTGINTPRNTEYAIKMHNQSAVQDAVTLYIMTSMLDGMDNYDPSTAGSYTVKDVDDIVPELYNISTKQWTENAATKLGINLTQEELQAVFTLDSKGVVGWVAGQEPTLETDENNNQQQPTKTLSSIAITTLPTKTEYEVGETVDMTGLVVTATYSDNSTENVTSSVTYTPALTEITASAGTKEITVTYGEKAAPEKITLTVTEATQQATLGSIITPDDYGKSIDYTVTVDGEEYTDWVVLYEDEANDRVFILKEDYMWFDEYAEATCEYDEEYAKIFKLGQVGHVHGSDMECINAKRMISDYSNWFNSQEYDGEGAIGSPTIELIVASLNETSQKDNLLNLSVETEGYRVNGAVEIYDLEVSVFDIYGIIVTCSCSDASYAYWGVTLASDFSQMSPLYNGKGLEIHPVICLSSNMLAEKVVGDNGSELIHIEKKQI